MNPDVALPRRPVLDTTMAYREAGQAGMPVALFLLGKLIPFERRLI